MRIIQDKPKVGSILKLYFCVHVFVYSRSIQYDLGVRSTKTKQTQNIGESFHSILAPLPLALFSRLHSFDEDDCISQKSGSRLRGILDAIFILFNFCCWCCVLLNGLLFQGHKAIDSAHSPSLVLILSPPPPPFILVLPLACPLLFAIDYIGRILFIDFGSSLFFFASIFLCVSLFDGEFLSSLCKQITAKLIEWKMMKMWCDWNFWVLRMSSEEKWKSYTFVVVVDVVLFILPPLAFPHT